MASHESYYNPSPVTNFAPPGLPATSSSSSAPPPPPPKPLPQSFDPGRSSTPVSNPPTPFTAPPVPPHPSSSIPPAPPPHPGSAQINSPPPSGPTPQSSAQQQAHIPPPSHQDQWLPPGVSEKSIPDLQQLLASPQLLSSLSQSHASYSPSTAPLSQLLQSNVALAQQISSLESQLRQLRDQTAQLLLNHTSLQTQWRRKQAEMDDALSPWGPRAMYQRLVSSISEQEALLRAITESFLDRSTGEDGYYGDGSGKASEKEVTDWVRRIREGTATLEKRREMRARWDEGRVGGWR